MVQQAHILHEGVDIWTFRLHDDDFSSKVAKQPWQQLQLNYDAEKIGYVKKAHNELLNIDYGKGCIFWSGLPIELANSAKVTQNVYQLITRQITHICDQESPVLVNRQKLREGELLLVVSESSSEQRIEIDSEQYAVIAPIRAGAILLLEGKKVQYVGGVTPL